MEEAAREECDGAISEGVMSSLYTFYSKYLTAHMHPGPWPLHDAELFFIILKQNDGAGPLGLRACTL